MRRGGYGESGEKMRPDQAFVQAVATLQRAAPAEWREFLRHFEVYAQKEAMACVSSPPADLHRMQGRAQQCASLQDLFGNAGKTADRIASKRAANSAAVQQRSI